MAIPCGLELGCFDVGLIADPAAEGVAAAAWLQPILRQVPADQHWRFRFVPAAVAEMLRQRCMHQPQQAAPPSATVTLLDALLVHCLRATGVEIDVTEPVTNALVAAAWAVARFATDAANAEELLPAVERRALSDHAVAVPTSVEALRAGMRALAAAYAAEDVSPVPAQATVAEAVLSLVLLAPRRPLAWSSTGACAFT